MGKEKKILNIEWICDNNTKELYNMAYGDCYCATGLFSLSLTHFCLVDLTEKGLSKPFFISISLSQVQLFTI